MSTLALAQCHPADLAAGGFGQGVGKVDETGIFVGGGGALHMVLQLLFQGVAGNIAALEHDGGLHHLAPDGVRHPGDGGFQHRFMLQQGAFHLKGPDPVARGLDQIVLAAHIPEVTRRVHGGHVAGVVEAVVPGASGGQIIPIVAQEQAQGLTPIHPDADLAFLARLHGLAVLIQQLDIVAGHRFAHGPEAQLHAREGGQAAGGLALAEALVDAEAGLGLPVLEHLGVEGLSGAAAMGDGR